MPRNLTTAMLNAITSPFFQPAVLVSIAFTGSTVNVWSGYGPITWNSTTYLGLGSLLSIGQVEDGATVEARGMTVEFSGLDPTLLPDALADFNIGLPMTIWLAAISGGAVVANPTILYSGATDQPSISIGPDEVILSVACESLLSVMNIPVDRRYTPQDQQMTYPGDLGFQFVYQIVDVALTWGGIGKGAAGAAKGSNAM